MTVSLRDLLALCQQKSVQMVDLKVVDLIGRWHHVTLPISQLNEELLDLGVGVDTSSYPGYRSVERGDMRAVPDLTTTCMDPFWERPTLSLICSLVNPDGSVYERCPRGVARRAQEFLVTRGIKGQAVFSPELEFHIFDALRFRLGDHQCSYEIDCSEAWWNAGSREPSNLGYKVRRQEGYQVAPPADVLYDLRSEMVAEMLAVGVPVRYHHHEVGSAGQCEVEVLFEPLLKMADMTMWMKYIIRNVARRHGKIATFMPKPLFAEAGSGMHVHQFLREGNRSLFYDPKGYACLSRLGLHYIGGLLTHAPALLAMTSPSTNSYRRLVPGYEAPVTLFFSVANRTAALRIPGYALTETEQRIEFRPPDATCDIYLCLAAMLMAGLDGIERKIDPTAAGFGPYDIDVFELSAEERARLPALPANLKQALRALEQDHDFLLRGEVFSEDLISAWIDYKRTHEVAPMAARPHPLEFELYHDL